MNQADVEATFAVDRAVTGIVSRAVTVSDDALIRQSSSLGSLGDETRAAPKSIADTWAADLEAFAAEAAVLDRVLKARRRRKVRVADSVWRRAAEAVRR